MSVRRKRLGDLLVERGLVSDDQLARALAQQRETGTRLGRILVQSGLVSEGQLLDTLAALHDVAVWDLLQSPPTEDAVRAVSTSTCARFTVIPVLLEGGALTLAMPNVDDIDAIDQVAYETKLQIEPVLASERQILALLEDIAGKCLDMGEIVDQAMEIVAPSSGDDDRNELITEQDTAPVLSLVNKLILDAIHRRASDVHIEPCRNKVEVRLRVDGHMVTIRSFPSNLLPMVVARIKIMAELDISQRRVPQDGRFNVRLKGQNIDVRVSVLPTHYGERVVVRILDGSVAKFPLDQLGFSASNKELFEQLISRPYGLVLVTGPTGSGKTTTLYASLNALKAPDKNIMTCEDPIEYDVEGIAQSQVNERAGLTFANQLRAILRQDPDVVLVGEIRDGETAETAMRASMTGHLVLSTMHCNDAVGALPRLFDMDVEPFLLSTSLIGVVSQRLVRLLCPSCKQEVEPTEHETALWQRTMGQSRLLDSVWAAQGCNDCHGVGYVGRIGVHEILPVSTELASLIAGRAPSDAILDLARQSGFVPKQADVLRRVAEGKTSFDEARRNVAFDALVSAACA